MANIGIKQIIKPVRLLSGFVLLRTSIMRLFFNAVDPGIPYSNTCKFNVDLHSHCY